MLESKETNRTQEKFNLNLELAKCSHIIAYPTCREELQLKLRESLYTISGYSLYDQSNFQTLIDLYVEDNLSYEASIALFHQGISELKLTIPDLVTASLTIIHYYIQKVVDGEEDPVNAACILINNVEGFEGSRQNAFYSLQNNSLQDDYTKYIVLENDFDSFFENLDELLDENGEFIQDVLKFHGLEKCNKFLDQCHADLLQCFIDF